jgi:hypothetical protein
MKTLPGICALALFWALPLAAQEAPRTDQPSRSAEDTLKPLTLPEIVIPQSETQEFTIPEVRVPSVRIPTVPEINIPEVRVPSINIPRITVPEIHIPEMTIPQGEIEGLDEGDRRELRQQLDEMRRNVQERREELRKLKKMLKKGDSEELHDALRDAQKELEEARADLAEAQKEMMMYGFGQNGTFVISGDGGTYAAALAPQAQGHGDMLIWTDSTSAMALAPGANAAMPKARRELMVRRFRSGDSSMGVMPAFPEFSTIAPTPSTQPFPFGSNNLVVVEGDSVIVHQNGQNGTIIQMRNKNANGTKGTKKKVTKIIIYDDDGDEAQTILTDEDVLGTSSDGQHQALLEKSSNGSGTTEGYSLSENAPNPFDHSTKISFTLGQSGHALLTVFDATGKVVRTLVDSDLPAGSHSVTFDSGDLPNGLYLYRIASGAYSETRTMTLQK